MKMEQGRAYWNSIRPVVLHTSMAVFSNIQKGTFAHCFMKKASLFCVEAEYGWLFLFCCKTQATLIPTRQQFHADMVQMNINLNDSQ